MSYQALFCPHCGQWMNEPDLEDTPENRVLDSHGNLGSAYTCGWCHERHTDYNHVVICRLIHQERATLVIKQAGQRALKMFEDLAADRRGRG